MNKVNSRRFFFILLAVTAFLGFLTYNSRIAPRDEVISRYMSDQVAPGAYAASGYNVLSFATMGAAFLLAIAGTVAFHRSTATILILTIACAALAFILLTGSDPSRRSYQESQFYNECLASNGRQYGLYCSAQATRRYGNSMSDVSASIAFPALIMTVVFFVGLIASWAANRSQTLTKSVEPVAPIAMASSPIPPRAQAISNTPQVISEKSLEQELQKLADMKAKGLIDDDEYKALKLKVIESQGN